MSTKVTTEIVRLQFDGNGFARGVKGAIDQTTELRKSLDFGKAIKNMGSLDRASKKVDFNHMSRGIESVNVKLGAMGVVAATVISNITTGILNSAKNLFNTSIMGPMLGGMKEFETQMGAIQTILANTASKGTTLVDVTAALDELNLYADKTIYNFTNMTDSIGKFTTAGVDLDVSVAAIKGISNLAAVSGSNAQQASNAMYQLSQAVSSGTVRLMDWNSVVNAGMGGQIFQDALIDTARIGNSAIDSIIDTAGGFRNSLEQEWLTSDVLLDTLAKFTGDVTDAQLEAIGYTQTQIAAIQEMGSMAQDAATKVKTFSQLKDTMAEAVESGWSQTWRLILGDFDQAKELFTGLSQTLDGVISSGADARNKLFEGWQQRGGRNAAIEALTTGLELVIEYSGLVKSAIQDIFPPTTSGDLSHMTHNVMRFVKSLKMGEEQSEKFKNVFRGLAAGVDIVKMAVQAILSPLFSMSGALGDVKIFDMASDLGLAVVSLREFLIEGGALDTIVGGAMTTGVNIIRTGADLLVKAFGLVSEAVTDIFPKASTDTIENVIGLIDTLVKAFGLVSEAVTDIFPKASTDTIENVIGLIDTLVKSFTLGEDVSGRFKNVIRGLAAIVDIAKMAFDAIIGPLFETAGEFGSIGDQILTLGSRLGNTMVWLRNVIKENKTFDRVVLAVQKAIAGVILTLIMMRDALISARDGFLGFKVVKKVIGYLKGIERSDIDTFFVSIGDALDRIGEISKDVSGFMRKMKKDFLGLSAVQDIIEYIENFDPSTLTEHLPSIENSMSKLNTLWSLVKDVGSWIMDFMPEMQASSDEVSTGGSDAIGEFFAGITDATKDFDYSLLITAIQTGMAGALLLSLRNLGKSNSLSSVMETALGSLLKDSGLKGMVTSITNVFGGVEGAMVAWQNNIKADMLMKIALSIAAITVSVIALSMVDSVKLGTALAAITVLMVDLFSGAGVVSKISGPGLASTSIALIGMSLALLILVFALNKLDGVDGVELGKSMASIAAGMAILVISIKSIGALDTVSLVKSSLAMIGLAFSLITIAQAVKLFGEMPVDVLVRGLSAAAVSLGAFILFSKGVNVKQLTEMSISVGILGGALGVFGYSLSLIGSLPLETILKGILGMAGGLTTLALSMRLMPADMIIKSAALVIAAGALVILGEAMTMLGGMSWDEVARSLVALGGSLLILTIALYGMTGTLAGSAALVVASVGLLALGKALTILGSMSWEQIAIALAALAGVFVVLGLAALILAPVLPAMFALGAAMLLIGIGAGVFGAGIYLAAAGLTLLALSAAAISGAIVLVGGAVISLLPTLMEALGLALVGFIGVIEAGAPAFFSAAKTLIIGFVEAVSETAPAVLNAVVELLLGLMSTIAEHLPEFTESGYTILLELLRGMSDHIEDIVVVVADIILAFTAGIEEKLPEIVEASFTLIIAFIDALSLAMEEHLPTLMIAVNGLGLSFVEGFITGIVGGAADVYNTVSEMGLNTVAYLKEALDSHSPSKKTQKEGENAASGFAGGIAGENSAIETAIMELIDILMLGLSSRDVEFFDLGVMLAERISTGFIIGFRTRLEVTAFVLTTLLVRMRSYTPRYYKLGVLLAKHTVDGFTTTFLSMIPLMTGVVQTLLYRLGTFNPRFYALGVEFMMSMLLGMTDQEEHIGDTITWLLDELVSTMTLQTIVFYNFGKNLALALAEGITDHSSIPEAAATAMAQAVSAAAAEEFGVHSPSTVFLAIAGFIVSGLTNGLDRGASAVAKSFTVMRKNAQNGMNRIIEDIDTSLLTNKSFNPVIRPVLDMGDVNRGMRNMSGTFNTVAISPSLTASKKSTQVGLDTNGSGDSSNEVNYYQYNNSPKALSAIEIYRRTQNQLNREKIRRQGIT